MHTDIAGALKNWIPYKLYLQDDQLLCRWLLLGDKDFTEPFFDETISRCKENTYNSLPLGCVSSLSILPQWSQHIDAIQPAAFIFHVSRCGSTLVSQLLSLAGENLVLSEVPFFDELLRMKKRPPGEDAPGSSALLKAAIDFYGARRNKKQCRLFIKTDSWHLLFYRQIRQLYPHAPFILLYRHPAEVIRSQQKIRGIQAVPGLIDPALFGFDKNNIHNKPLDEYMSMVLEKYFLLMDEIIKNDPLAIPANYNEGALDIVKKIAAVTSMPLDDEYMQRMSERMCYHGKYPDQVFGKESNLLIVPAHADKAVAQYESLDKLRTGVFMQVQDQLI